MIKLVFNELYKIFHKKTIYILTGIVIFLFVALGLLNKALSNSSMDMMLIDVYKQSIDTLDLEKQSDAELYANLQPMIDTVEIANNKKLDSKSPEKYFLDMTIFSELSDMYTAKYVEKNEDKYNELKSKVDADIASLDNFDWKKNIEAEIQDAEVLLSIELPEGVDSQDVLKEKVRVLKYRLDNNIPESYSDASTYLEDYYNYYLSYQSTEKDESKIVNRDDLAYKRKTEAEIAVRSYKLDNNLIKADYTEDTAYNGFVSMLSVNIFVIVCILMIGGAIVAEEYSKGTIKQLLVRPYKRSKIIISKIIATFIVVFIFMLVIAVVNALATGITSGEFKSLIEPEYLYNYNTHAVFKTNIIYDGFMHFVAVLPEMIIVTLFTVLMSALVGNTALAVILGFVLTYIPSMFQALIDKVKILSYLPMYNWDLSPFLYGGMSTFKYATLPKGIIVSCVTIVLLIIGIIITFMKKDIKNQ